jgi:hypothetical protein
MYRLWRSWQRARRSRRKAGPNPFKPCKPQPCYRGRGYTRTGREASGVSGRSSPITVGVIRGAVSLCVCCAKMMFWTAVVLWPSTPKFIVKAAQKWAFPVSLFSVRLDGP